MKTKKKKILLMVLIIQTFLNGIETKDVRSNYLDQNRDTKLLSRRKRFLIFPDGSSFQLVFCVQTSALITIGDIFLYGNTAALAWSLPTDSKFFYMFKRYDKVALRRGDFKNSVYYVDDKGQLISKVPYKRTKLANPTLAKRSIDEEETFREKLKAMLDRNKMHEQQKAREYLKKDHMDEDTRDYHRNSRAELIGKVEKLLTALGKDGRQCVLYKLCKASQSSTQQGTFLEELLRIIFTLPKGTQFTKDEHQEYDKAHTSTENCDKFYPGCNHYT